MAFKTFLCFSLNSTNIITFYLQYIHERSVPQSHLQQTPRLTRCCGRACQRPRQERQRRRLPRCSTGCGLVPVRSLKRLRRRPLRPAFGPPSGRRSGAGHQQWRAHGHPAIQQHSHPELAKLQRGLWCQGQRGPAQQLRGPAQPRRGQQPLPDPRPDQRQRPGRFGQPQRRARGLLRRHHRQRLHRHHLWHLGRQLRVRQPALHPRRLQRRGEQPRRHQHPRRLRRLDRRQRVQLGQHQHQRG